MFIFGFTVLVDFPSHIFTVSLFVSNRNRIVEVSPSLIIILDYFSLFPRCPWMLPLIWIAAYFQTTLLSDHIVARYHPPPPPLEVFFWTRPLHWWQCHWWKTIFYWHCTSTPSKILWQPTLQKLARIDNTTVNLVAPEGRNVYRILRLWDHCLNWKYVSNRSYYRYKS